MKRVYFIVSIIFLIMVSYLKSFAQIQVEAGDLAYFYVNYDQTLKAGESQTIKITAKDAFDNDITNFNSTVEIKSDDKVYTVSLINGVGTFKFSTSKVGDYFFQVFYNGKNYLIKDGYTKGLLKGFKVYVKNNKVEMVDIITSPEFIPGYTKKLKILAKDKYSNPVVDTSGIEQLLEVETNGTFKTTIDVKSLKNGSKEIEFTPLEPYDIVIKVKSQEKVLGETKLKYKKQDIGEIKISYPDKVKAGQEFEIYLSVYDTEGLIIRVYDRIGKPIKLSHNGSGILYPNTIQPSEFVNGEAKVKLVYTKTEEIKIVPMVEDKVLPSKKVQEKPTEKKTEKIEKDITKIILEKSQEKDKSEKTQIDNKEPIKILNLIVPSSFGRVSEVITQSKNQYLITLENPNNDLEFIPIKRDISVKNKIIGKLNLSQEKEGSLSLKIELGKDYYVNTKLDKEKNLIRVEIYQ